MASTNEDAPEVIGPRHLCRGCQVGLLVGTTWSEFREKKGDYMCNRCAAEYHREYRKGNIHTIEKAQEIEEQRARKIEEFSAYWNSPDFKHMPTSDRIVEIFRKHFILRPETGFTQDEIIDVLFAEEQVFDVYHEVEQYINITKLRGFEKVSVKTHLSSFTSKFADEIRMGKQQSAIYKFDALIDAVNSRYRGQEELVAKPAFENKRTGQKEYRYYLLSHTDELEKREAERNKRIENAKAKNTEERKLVESKAQPEQEQRHTGDGETQ